MCLNFGLLILSFVLTLAPHTPLSTQRDVGLFSIRFWALSTNVPDAGDYNELAVDTTEFLDKTMENVFEDSPATHAFTTVNSYKVKETYVVEFAVTSSFYIPGDIPTPGFLFTEVEQAFTTGSDAYIGILQDMSSTNPLATVYKIDFVDPAVARAEGTGITKSSGGGDSGSSLTTLVLGPVLAFVGVLALATAYLTWSKKRNQDDASTSEKATLCAPYGADDEESTLESSIPAKKSVNEPVKKQKKALSFLSRRQQGKKTTQLSKRNLGKKNRIQSYGPGTSASAQLRAALEKDAMEDMEDVSLGGDETIATETSATTAGVTQVASVAAFEAPMLERVSQIEEESSDEEDDYEQASGDEDSSVEEPPSSQEDKPETSPKEEAVSPWDQLGIDQSEYSSSTHGSIDYLGMYTTEDESDNSDAESTVDLRSLSSSPPRS